MPERGGPTSWSGIYFQDRVAVYQLVRMLCDRALNLDDPIISVRIEAPSVVDDVLVTRQSGARVFQSVKESIDRSANPAGPWAKLWSAIRSLIELSDFDQDRDLVE